MKPCFTTLACPNWSLEQILTCCQENSFPALELRGLRGEFDLTKAPELECRSRQSLRQRLEAIGTSIVCLGTSCVLSSPREEEFAPSLDTALGHADLASELGVPYIRVFGGKIPPEEDPAACSSRVARRLDEIARYAGPRGVSVLIETHDDFISCDRLAGLFQQVEDEAVGILWDVHHPYRLCGEEPSETWERIGAKVRHVHLKDSLVESGSTRYVLLGEGDVPLRQALLLLHRAGYAGCLSFEWEKAWHPELPDPSVAIPHYARTIRTMLSEIGVEED